MFISLIDLYNKYGLNKPFEVKAKLLNKYYLISIIEIATDSSWIKIDYEDLSLVPPGPKLGLLAPVQYFGSDITEPMFFDSTINPNTVNKQKCNCDFYSVILITGCKCGGI